MRKIASLIGLSALLAAGAAAAQGAYVWESLASSATVTIAYNPLSVSKANGVSSVTIKVAGTPGNPLSLTAPNGQPMSPAYYVERMAITCAAGTYADLENTGYDASGAQLYSVQNVHGMVAYEAGSAPAAVAQKVCP